MNEFSPKAWRDEQNQPWIPINQQHKNFPAANVWMWTYCEWLGSFKDEEGNLYDLGLYLNDLHTPSYAIVYGNIPGDYISGPISLDESMAHLKETVNRGLAMGFIKPI